MRRFTTPHPCGANLNLDASRSPGESSRCASRFGLALRGYRGNGDPQRADPGGHGLVHPLAASQPTRLCSFSPVARGSDKRRIGRCLKTFSRAASGQSFFVMLEQAAQPFCAHHFAGALRRAVCRGGRTVWRVAQKQQQGVDRGSHRSYHRKSLVGQGKTEYLNTAVGAEGRPSGRKAARRAAVRRSGQAQAAPSARPA
jgi:hypothetical protein